jgi:hypothetical protein
MPYLPDTDTGVGDENEQNHKGFNKGCNRVVIFKEGEHLDNNYYNVTQLQNTTGFNLDCDFKDFEHPDKSYKNVTQLQNTRVCLNINRKDV